MKCCSCQKVDNQLQKLCTISLKDQVSTILSLITTTEDMVRRFVAHRFTNIGSGVLTFLNIKERESLAQDDCIIIWGWHGVVLLWSKLPNDE
jgi:hypothetical protein